MKVQAAASWKRKANLNGSDETKIFDLNLFNFVFLQYEKDLGFQGNRES